MRIFANGIKKKKTMSTIELEAQKAFLAREILCINDEAVIHNIRLFLKNDTPSVSLQEKPKKRKIGFLEGKAKVTFHEEWSMTPEELEMA